jgi:hypothetical protein
MTRPHRSLKKVALIALTLPLALLAAATVARAQKRQAIIVLRTPGAASVAPCDGAAELNYQLVSEAKLNGKEEVRLAGNLGPPGAATLVSRKQYEETRKVKLRDLFALRWGGDGVLYAVSLEGQTPVPVLPDDAKPQKNADQSLSAFYSVMLTGEAREGKQKRQISLPLRDIHKIYFVNEGAVAGDTLFRHAADEKSVVLWEAYLRRTNNYRQAEANSHMREALITCARADLDSFAAGDYSALDKARQRAARAQSVRGDAVTQQLVAGVAQAQQKVDGVRAQVEGLVTARKYDEAIDAAEPIRIYLSSWPALDDMYREALKRSHELHLFKGEEALRLNQLDAALSECGTAWKRLPDSPPARDCVCKSRVRVSLRDAQNFRQQRRPKDAKELLERQLADADCSRDTEVAKKLEESKCEYSQQLLAEARRLVGTGGAAAVVRTAAAAPQRRRGGRAAPPPAVKSAPAGPGSALVRAINAQNKKDFRDARERLVLAAELCQGEDVRTLLASVNRSLSGYCLAEAQKATQRGDAGTAYVYLHAAQGYTPDDSQVLGLLGQARNNFEERTRVSVGVVFDDKSGSRYGPPVLNEIRAAVESVATEAGLARPAVLEHGQAAQALRAIQSGRALNSPTAVFYGDLLAAHVNSEAPSRRVASVYTLSNPERERWDRAIDEQKELYERCKKQYGEPQCTGHRDRIEQMRAHRNPMPRTVDHNYSYLSTHHRVAGDLRLSFRATDSISRSALAAETLSANVNYQCEQRDEVHERDSRVNPSRCNAQGDESYVGEMGGRVRAEARAHALAHLRALPLGYYRRARGAANRQQAVEDYVCFLFLTGDKQGGEALEAQRALLTFDPELETDGVLR